MNGIRMVGRESMSLGLPDDRRRLGAGIHVQGCGMRTCEEAVGNVPLSDLRTWENAKG